MKVVIAGGGTGGHLYPGLAVAEELKKQGVSTLFMVSNRDIDKAIVADTGFEFIAQDIMGFSGESVLKKSLALVKLFGAVKAAGKHIERGDKVLVLGGFAAAPAALASIYKGAELYIHEQNSVMGLVNKLTCFKADKVFVSYENTAKAPKKSVVTGNPVRRELMHGEIKAINEKRLFILGGSSGSRILNTQVAAVAQNLLAEGFTIFHQTGAKLYDETVAEYLKHGVALGDRVEVTPYIKDMKSAYAECDLVIARSGSGTVFEVTYAKRPAIYVPFAKATANHQYYNAVSAQKNGYALVLQEAELKDRLFMEIVSVFNVLNEYKRNLRNVTPLDSVQMILSEMGF